RPWGTDVNAGALGELGMNLKTGLIIAAGALGAAGVAAMFMRGKDETEGASPESKDFAPGTPTPAGTDPAAGTGDVTPGEAAAGMLGQTPEAGAGIGAAADANAGAAETTIPSL